MTTQHYTLLLASYLEPEHVERIRQVSPNIEVIYRPDLVAKPRYAADHHNSINRTPEQEAEWQTLLARADILFDFDTSHRNDLPELAPRLRWVQSANAGIGQMVRQLSYDTRMPQTIFTTSSGIHAKPLAEFCALVMLMFVRGLFQIQEQQQRRHWQRYSGTDLTDRTVGILGVGRIGREVARTAKALGMRVIGTKRTVEGVDPASLYLDTLYAPTELPEVLRRSEFLVIVTPHTNHTERLIGAEQLALLPHGAVLINIGRGAVLDEQALIAALQSGHLGGAALDVFDVEPLPAENPLWALPNVLICPHSGSTTDRENTRLTDLFCENLRRFLAGETLLNVLDHEQLY